MPRFELLVGGSHSEGEKTIRVGEMIDSPHPLDKMFVGKWKRYADVPVPSRQLAPVDVGPAAHSDATESDEDEDDKPSLAEGQEDVTGDYPGAAEQDLRVVGLRVMIKGKLQPRFNVYDGASLTPINDTPLTGPKLVAKLAELGVAPEED